MARGWLTALGVVALLGAVSPTAPAAKRAQLVSLTPAPESSTTTSTSTSTTEPRAEPTGSGLTGAGIAVLAVVASFVGGLLAAFFIGMVLLACALGAYHGLRRLVAARRLREPD